MIKKLTIAEFQSMGTDDDSRALEESEQGRDGMTSLEDSIADALDDAADDELGKQRRYEESQRDLERQRTYVRHHDDIGGNYDLIMADAFVRGIRDLGYKSTATALDELNDNSYQAGAENVHHVFGFPDGNTNKPDKIAIVDDGHGMEPQMIRLAVMWGGTHRENDRTGFGRYGYGLPSASMSQGTCFTVYSVVEGGQLFKVTVDLEEISAQFAQRRARVLIEEPGAAELPLWVQNYVRDQIAKGNLIGENGQLVHGTVVIIERLDRLSWKTSAILKRELLHHFGDVYRNFLANMRIFVDGTLLRPLDPLFITLGAQYFDWDSDRAAPYDPLMFEVKDPQGIPHVVKVRFSFLPPRFASIDKSRDASRRTKNANPRFDVMDEHKGIIVCRNGREIDVVTKCPWTVFRNNDRYWNIEVDFPAALDEEFSITTSKQRVIVSDRIWDLLEENGVRSNMDRMRKRYDIERAEITTLQEREDIKRRSESAMEAATKYKTETIAPNLQRIKREKEWLVDQVAREHVETGRPLEDVLRDVKQRTEERAKQRPYKVMKEHVPGGPFYRPDMLGGQRFLYLNTAHRFFTDVYAGPDTSQSVRDKLEVLLFALAHCELDASGQRLDFYENERPAWSLALRNALSELDHIDSTEDARESAEADDVGIGAGNVVDLRTQIWELERRIEDTNQPGEQGDGLAEEEVPF